MRFWETGWGGRARLFQKINNCLKEWFIYLYIHNSLECKNPFHYSGQHSICMYRHWSSRQISHPPPSDSGFGRETLSKINQDSRRSYSPAAKNNNIICPKPCENKAVSRSSLHGKKSISDAPQGRMQQRKLLQHAWMPQEALHGGGKFTSVPSFCRAGVRAGRNAENTLGSPRTHTAGSRSASHVITWAHVVGSKYLNPSFSPVSVLPSNIPST